jgi:hypothetical protein
MSRKRNRKPRRNGVAHTPRSITSASLPSRTAVSPKPPRVTRPRVSGQYLARSRPARSRRPDGVPPEVSPVPSLASIVLDLAPEPAPGPAPTVLRAPEESQVLSEQPRRSVKRLVLAGVLALEVAVLLALLVPHVLRDGGTDHTAADRYAAPAPVPAGTSFVRTQVISSQSLRVTHWIHTDRPVYRVRIDTPQVPGVAADALVASGLILASDGRAVPDAKRPTAGAAHTYAVPPGRRIYVTYVLTGAIQHSAPPAGRALAVLTTLGVTTIQDPVVQTTHSIVGASILTLACSPNRSGAVPRPCGTARNGSWQVELHAPHTGDRVLAQMDLA